MRWTRAQRMSRPTFARIDTRAFVANYCYAKSLAPKANAVAVIKANAYGHGAVALARALEEKADALGVACSEEALELRESGIRSRIVLLGGVFAPEEIADAASHKFAITVHNQTQLDWLLAARPERPLQVWLKVDTGMHRLGFAPQKLQSAYRQLRDCAHVSDIVVMSHFACADQPGLSTTRDQLALFVRALDDTPAPCSLANSAAILAWPDTHRDWIRPGIMLYGSSPLDSGETRTNGLRAVMRFESRLISIRQLAAGDSIGYGARYTCDRPTRIGVVAAGYADGYPRNAPDGTPVAVNGRPACLAGRVSMDMLTIDLGQQADAQIGDPVQLWGEQIAIGEVARRCDTIPYELFTRVSQRVHFDYLGGRP